MAIGNDCKYTAWHGNGASTVFTGYVHDVGKFNDGKIEESVNENLSMMRFCDLGIEDKEPDHSVLSRFCTELTEKKSFDRLLKKINRQLVAHKVIVRNGAGIVDATLTDTPRCPKGKTEYELVEDRKEDQRFVEESEKEEVKMKLVKKQQPGVDNGDMRRWFRTGRDRYVGLAKTHTQHLLEAIAYNL